MRSVTVNAGIRRGLQAAETLMTAATQAQATIDLIEDCIKLPIRNGTQKWQRRGLRACDAPHGLTMFLSIRIDCVTLSPV